MVSKCEPKWDVVDLEVAHVVGALEVVVDEALAGAAEGLDGVELPLLHPRRLPALHDRHRLTRVDPVLPQAVPVQVPDRLHCSPRPSLPHHHSTRMSEP